MVSKEFGPEPREFETSQYSETWYVKLTREMPLEERMAYLGVGIGYIYAQPGDMPLFVRAPDQYAWDMGGGDTEWMNEGFKLVKFMAVMAYMDDEGCVSRWYAELEPHFPEDPESLLLKIRLGIANTEDSSLDGVDEDPKGSGSGWYWAGLEEARVRWQWIQDEYEASYKAWQGQLRQL